MATNTFRHSASSVSLAVANPFVALKAYSEKWHAEANNNNPSTMAVSKRITAKAKSLGLSVSEAATLGEMV